MSEPYSIDIIGMLLPWSNGEPVYMFLDGCPDVFLMLYTTLEKLRVDHRDEKNVTVKKIDDPGEFLDCLPYWSVPNMSRLRVAVDPHGTDRGTTKFSEVIRHNA